MSSKKKKKVFEEEIIENIQGIVLDQIMGERYAVYAKDVIQDRAIPDVRDGLKPVQRRIVYYMEKTGNTIDKPTRKCAHIVGGVMGQYHPHGDSSIYEALVRMSQPWALRECLVDFQGNNGSMDGDGPAAFRYTEARLSALSQELVRDLDKDTVDMTLTFDDLNKEPTVLPAHFPNLLVNGAEGIAVGMATHIPPHNLREVIGALIYRLKHPDCGIEPLLNYVKGPDFPTGGKILGKKAIEELYRTGHAHLNLLSKADIETNGAASRIVITEIPYGVIKSDMVYAIDKLRADRSVPGIEEVRDETDKSGLRIAIDLRPDAKKDTILKYLSGKGAGKGGIAGSYSANMVAIVDGRPKTLDLVSYCDHYLAFRREIEERRCLFDKKKAEERLHIVLGLMKAIDVLDEVIRIIRHSDNKGNAKENLQRELGFSEAQSESIVMMPLYKLTHTDIETLLKEKADLESSLVILNGLLEDPIKMRDYLIEDLRRIAKTYGSDRRTEICDDEDAASNSVDARELIVEEECYVALSRDGYLKRSSPKSFKGSGGERGVLPGLKEGDPLVYTGVGKTTDYLLAFTSLGNYVYIPVNEIREGKWLEEGSHLNTVVSIAPGEKMVVAFLTPVFRDDLYFVILSKKAVIKRVAMSAFPVTRRNRAINAIRLSREDSVVAVALTNGGCDLLVTSVDGYGEVYNENQVPLTGLRSGGVKAGSFNGRDLSCLLAFPPAEKTRTKALLATDLGYTRVIDLSKIPSQERLSPRAKPLYPCFKNEPHRLMAVYDLENLEAPLSLTALLHSGKTSLLEVPDFYLTPVEKYAKRPDGFLRKDPVEAYYPLLNKALDPNMESVPLPQKERPSTVYEEPGEERSDEDFEQISLFDE